MINGMIFVKLTIVSDVSSAMDIELRLLLSSLPNTKDRTTLDPPCLEETGTE